MDEQRTLSFGDLDDDDEAVAIVRAVPGGVGLMLSKKQNGDIGVFMPADVAVALSDALRDVAG